MKGKAAGGKSGRRMPQPDRMVQQWPRVVTAISSIASNWRHLRARGKDDCGSADSAKATCDCQSQVP